MNSEVKAQQASVEFELPAYGVLEESMSTCQASGAPVAE